MRGPLPYLAGLAHSAATGLELPASGRTGSGAGRSQDPAAEAGALARVKKRPKPKGEPSRIFQPLLACCSEQARPAPPLVRARDPVVSSSGASTCGRPALRTTMFRSASLETTVSGGRFPTLKQSVDTRW